jgi:hypothetical protein
MRKFDRMTISMQQTSHTSLKGHLVNSPISSKIPWQRLGVDFFDRKISSRLLNVEPGHIQEDWAGNTRLTHDSPHYFTSDKWGLRSLLGIVGI